MRHAAQRNPRKSHEYVHVVGKIAFVQLTQGQVAIIDAEDAPEVGKRLWRAELVGNNWYAYSGRHREFYLHRVLAGPPPNRSQGALHAVEEQNPIGGRGLTPWWNWRKGR